MIGTGFSWTLGALPWVRAAPVSGIGGDETAPLPAAIAIGVMPTTTARTADTSRAREELQTEVTHVLCVLTHRKSSADNEG